MDREEINRKIKESIKNILSLDIELSDFADGDLIEIYGINSIDALEILLDLENIFEIEIDDEDLSAELINDSNHLLQYIADKVERKSSL